MKITKISGYQLCVFEKILKIDFSSACTELKNWGRGVISVQELYQVTEKYKNIYTFKDFKYVQNKSPEDSFYRIKI